MASQVLEEELDQGSEQDIIPDSVEEPRSNDDSELRQWMQGSVVVDNDGNPIPVYHGGSGGIQDFKTPAFFTMKQEGAQWYAEERGGPEGAVYSTYLSIKKPFSLYSEQEYMNFIELTKRAGVKSEVNRTQEGWTFNCDTISQYSPYGGTEPTDMIYIPAVQKQLTSEGYDGLHFEDALMNSWVETYVIWNPSQARLASSHKIENGLG